MLRSFCLNIALYFYVFLFVCLCLMPLNAQADLTGIPKHYEVREVGQFSFAYPPRWRKVAQVLMAKAQSDLHDLARSLGYQAEGKFWVRLAPPGREFAEIQPYAWHPPSYVSGLAYPKRGLMTVRLRGIDGMDGIHQTFRHELSHLLLARSVGGQVMPLWFIEGVAMLHSGDFGTIERFWLLSRARISGQWPALDDLRYRFPNNAHELRIAYALSLEFLLFLQKQRPNLLSELTSAMRQNTAFLTALEQITAQNWQSLLKSWDAHSRYRYNWLTALTDTSLLWFGGAILLIIGYIRVKRRRKKQFAQLDE
jgi:hypothetical protein